MPKIRISAVSYLNTKPFVFGLLHGPVKDQINLSLDTPAECARKLFNHEADIGLLPIAALSETPNAKIIPGYCIAATGQVGSVLLVSDLPVNEIKTVLLDYQSRTSVELVKIIAAQLWKINPTFLSTTPGYEEAIKHTTAGVIIGDRALKLKNNYKYVYDLALCWYELTQLPFVFACWAFIKEIDGPFLMQFEKSLAFGISHIDTLLQEQPDLTPADFNTTHYLKNQIQYVLDENKKKGIDRFLSYLRA